MIQPEYIFETSWEVCNRVGGIYAVLSTRAASMQKEYKDRVVFFGPDLGKHSDLFFKEDRHLLRGRISGVRVGRWQVEGQPIAVLLRWDELWNSKDDIYAWAWEKFGVESHAAYGDYDESSLFAYAVGQKMEELYFSLGKPLTIVHANEWQTAFALLYMKERCQQTGTVFTTHATSIGRSIAGNGKPLYDYFDGYNGCQMARELNMVSKHSAERAAAHAADCFTTVSDLTAKECAQLLERKVDIVLPNGFEGDMVPKGAEFAQKRIEARLSLMRYAEERLGHKISDTAFWVGISGRQEWKNKGIDVFLESMEQLSGLIQTSDREVVALLMIPYLNIDTRTIGRVHILPMGYYLPCERESPAIDGKTYFDLLIGLDMTVFPSYYEPWGYTPMESVAFHIPTVTTSLAGFGLWAEKQQKDTELKPVTVIHRTDGNFRQVVSRIADSLIAYMRMDNKRQDSLRRAASSLAKKADWKHFFPYYRKAYDMALSRHS